MEHAVLDRIEELRVQMQRTALDKDLTDPRVVKVSKKLDALISEFYSSQGSIKRT